MVHFALPIKDHEMDVGLVNAQQIVFVTHDTKLKMVVSVKSRGWYLLYYLKYK